MKRICTLLAIFCLLVITQNAKAQSCNVSYTNPNPTPAFGTPLDVNSFNGFISDNPNSVTDFPKNKTTVLTSPSYHYNGDQATIYFAYTLTKAEAGNTTAQPTITISYGTNSTITCTAGSIFTFIDGTNIVYFSISPSSLFSAGTDFKISLTITLEANDKVLVANSLTTNAILSSVSAPLPVKFVGFYAKKINGGVSLTWNVGDEDNLSGYEVQRSIDGSNFSKIGFAAATHSASYSFVDSKNVETGYYRIRSVDLDGKYAYSTIVSIKGEQSSVVLKAFPTPVTSQLTVQYPSAGKSSKIEILSADGRMVKSTSLAINSQQTTIDLSSLRAGAYIVRLLNESSVETLKIIKQ